LADSPIRNGRKLQCCGVAQAFGLPPRHIAIRPRKDPAVSIAKTSLLFLAALVSCPALADDMAAVPPGGPVAVNVSYAINETILSTAPEALAAMDAGHRNTMMQRAEAECAGFLATIATDCAVTGINISTQVNSYPGQPPTLYVNSNVTLQITLRDTPAAP
jgi:hypothetical protein